MSIWLNGEARRVAPGISVTQLLVELELAANHVAVEVNGELVPREGHAACELREGDRLEVVTLVGGG